MSQSDWNDEKILENVLAMVRSLDTITPKGNNKSKSSLITSLQLSVPYGPGVILPYHKLREIVAEQLKSEEAEDE